MTIMKNKPLLAIGIFVAGFLFLGMTFSVLAAPSAQVSQYSTPTPGPEVRPNVVRVNTGVGDIPSLDPNVAEDTTSITLIENSFVGLTRLNEVTNELMPGMATDWAVSGDGKVYTYTLRTDVPLAESLADLEWRGARRRAMETLCRRIGAGELLSRVARWRED